MADIVVVSVVISNSGLLSPAAAIAPGAGQIYDGSVWKAPIIIGFGAYWVSEWIYNNRHLVENLWARLKEWRAVATRYEKTAHSFLGVLCLAATADWLK